MIEKEYPVYNRKETNTSDLMREQIINILEQWNIQSSEIFSQMRDTIYNQQYKFFDKIESASCNLTYIENNIFVTYKVNYKSSFDIEDEFLKINRCNTLYDEGRESLMYKYKRMCRRDKEFSDYDFEYINVIVRTKNPIQIEKTEQEQTLKITYKIDL